MTWIDNLADELRRRDSERVWDERLHALPPPSSDAIVARADALVRSMLDQVNQTVLGGRGAVGAAPVRWGLYMWELWWEPTRERGPYVVVLLLRDSHGIPYLKIHGRRLALEDIHLERRLQRALRAAVLQPLSYTPRERAAVR